MILFGIKLVPNKKKNFKALEDNLNKFEKFYEGKNLSTIRFFIFYYLCIIIIELYYLLLF